MALVIKDNLDHQLLSANNDAILTVSGNTVSLSGVTEYKYTMDIYTGEELLATLKSFPNPVVPVGVFNLKSVLSNITEYDFLGYRPDGIPDYDAFYLAPKSWKEITFGLGEEYVALGQYQSPDNLIQSDNYYFWNASLSWKDQNTMNPMQFFMSGQSDESRTFMSNFPSDQYPQVAYPGDTLYKSWLYYFNGVPNAITTLAVRTYSIDGTLVGAYKVDNPYGALVGMQAISTGIEQLRGSTYISIDGPPIMFAGDVVSYTVQIGPNVGYSTPEIPFLYNTVDGTQPCVNLLNTSYYPKFNVYWLNEFGGFDSWKFITKSESTINKTSASYKSIYGKVGSTGMYEVSLSDSNRKVYYTRLEDRIQLTTDFLQQWQVTFLKGLFSSPVIFLEDESGYQYSVVIDNENYNLTKRRDQKLYTLTFDLLYSHDNFRQGA